MDSSRSWQELSTGEEQSVQAMFQASIFVELGNGQKALFWSDRWLQGKSLIDIAPCLYNAVNNTARKKRTVAQALQGDQWIGDIAGALTVQVILEYLKVWDLTREIVLAEERDDRICWKWTQDGSFSTSSAYRAFFIGQHPTEGAPILRKARAPAKCKFFIWLVIHDRCWTADRCRRHGLQDDDSCALCAQLPETINHLLIGCSFSREVWFRVLLGVGWVSIAPTIHTVSLVAWWTDVRKRIQKDDRRGFDSLVALVCWLLWKERNGRTFDRRARTTQEMNDVVVEELAAWLRAGFKHLQPMLAALGVDTGRSSSAM